MVTAKHIKTYNDLEDIEFFKEGKYLNFPRSLISDKEYSDILEQLKEVYQDACNSKEQAGYSKSEDTFFAKVFIIYFFDRGGYAVLSKYLTCNYDGESSEVINPKFDYLYEDYNMQCECEAYKRLMHISYNHILPDGKIVEYFYDEKHSFDWDSEPGRIFSDIQLQRKPYIEKKNLEENIVEGKKTNKIKV